jgi:hypothetical protein
MRARLRRPHDGRNGFSLRVRDGEAGAECVAGDRLAVLVLVLGRPGAVSR